jgi:hypothetical protein
VFRPGLLASNSPYTTESTIAKSNVKGAMDVGASAAGPLVPIAATSHRADNRVPAGTPASALPIELPNGKQASAVTTSTGAPTASFPPGHFREAELRLRELGATYYLLETLGPGSGQYRFYCKVAFGPKPEEMLAFFATDRDPLAAMHQVARQVEAWRMHANR